MQGRNVVDIRLIISLIALISSGASCGLENDSSNKEATVAQGEVKQEVLQGEPPVCGPELDGQVWYDEDIGQWFICSNSTGTWSWLLTFPCFTVSKNGTDQLCPPQVPSCAPPNGYPGTQAYINIFTTAIGRAGTDNACRKVGESYTATNPQYVWCRRWGGLVSDGSNFNHWWLWTDLDTGGSGWISAYYIANQGDDHADGIPDCW